MLIDKTDLTKLIMDVHDVFLNGEETSGVTGVTELAAEATLDAELLGYPAFGLSMLSRECDRIMTLSGSIDRIERNATAFDTHDPDTPISVVDATFHLGQWATAWATIRAAHSARSFGVGAVGIRHVGAIGMLGVYARHLAIDGLVTIFIANSPAKVAPYRGHSAAVGTNPFALGFPRGTTAKMEFPLVIDYSTSLLTMGVLKRHQQSGEPLAEGTAMDALGCPTTDPSEVASLLPRGLAGSLQGLSIELMARSLLTDGRPKAPGRGAFLLVLDPRRLTNGNGNAAAVDCAQLCEAWRCAGGHVPAKYDRLASVPDDVMMNVSDTDYQSLIRLIDGGIIR